MTIQEAFNQFHADNPWVYDELVRLMREAKTNRGYTQWSVDGAYHVVRWERARSTIVDDGSPWKLNNNFTSRYARMILKNCPDLAGFIKIRVLRS